MRAEHIRLMIEGMRPDDDEIMRIAEQHDPFIAFRAGFDSAKPFMLTLVDEIEKLQKELETWPSGDNASPRGAS